MIEALTQSIPIEEKARMIEAEIREFIKAYDPYLFANTSTAAQVFPGNAIVVAVCYENDVIFKEEYPDTPNITIVSEFAHAFTHWRTRRAS